MALLDRLREDFDDATLARGRNYFHRGAVSILRITHRSLRATVQGEHSYTVEIDWDGGFLEYECSCPYFADRGYPCKHIWATLLDADERGKLPRQDELEEMSGSAELPERPQQPPVWKQRLSTLRAQMNLSAGEATDPWPAGRELVYAIDWDTSVDGGGLCIELLSRARRRDGQWERPKSLKHLSRSQLSTLPEPLDRQILQMLAGAALSDYEWGYGDAEGGDLVRQYQLASTAFETILKPMCDTGRCFLRRERALHTVPLTWDDGEPWEFVLGLARDGNSAWKVEGSLVRASERIGIETPDLVVPGGLIFLADRVAKLNDGRAFELLSFLRRDEKLAARVGQEWQLLTELFSLPRLPRIELPQELGISQVAGAAKPHLRIGSPRQDQYAYPQWLPAEMTFNYEGQIVPSRQNGSAILLDDPKRILRRDIFAESIARSRLRQVGFKNDNLWNSSPEKFYIQPKALPEAVRRLVSEGWRIEADGKLYRNAGQVRIDVRSNIDWFEVNATADFDGTIVSLPRLLASLRKGQTLITLDDGSVGIVPEEWLKRYGLLTAVAQEENGNPDALLFAKSQAGLLDALLAARPEVTVDAAFSAARTELRNFDGIRSQEPPEGFTGTLRPYQKEGLGWTSFLRRFGFGGVLADDMGLGKTVQVLALLESRRAAGEGASLVVVPRSLVFNWKAEAARFAPALRILDHTGVQRDRHAERFSQFDLVLTTYGTLRKDVLFFQEHAFDYVILDEAQAVKNAASESAKAARLLNARHRLALSGTPVQNHLGELWSLFEFLNPGMLGASSALATAGSARSIDPESAGTLAAALRPFILRRTKDQVASDLPEKLEQTLYCDLDAAQRKLYDELRDHYRQALLAKIDRDGLGKSKIMVLEALLRLRQAACHPGLLDKERLSEGSAKLDTLLASLDEVHEEGHKALVFSQFTSFLAIVRAKLDELKIPYEYLDGKTRDRKERVERFQTDPDCKLFLVSLKAGGLGLNLTAAEYVFLLDPWWNPAVEAQAIDRAHRIGQTRRVFAYRLITRDTVEQKVLDLQKTKRDLADAVITADNRTLANLKREDLELLLS